MIAHRILTLREFYKQGSLITSQLDSSFNEGVAPVLIFPREKIEQNILVELANYLRNKHNEKGNYPILVDIRDMKSGTIYPLIIGNLSVWTLLLQYSI